MAFATLEELKAAVKDLSVEVVEDIVGFINDSVSAEKQRGIKARQTANAEAVKLKAKVKEITGKLQELGYDPDDEEADLDTFLVNLKGDGKAEGDLEKTVKKLERSLAKTQKALEEKEKAERELLGKHQESSLRQSLTKALSDQIHGPEFAIDALISKGAVRLSEDGDPVWIDGEDEMDFDTGVKNFLSKNQGILKNKQKGGAGTPATGSGKSNTYTVDRIKSMTAKEIAALPPDDYKAVMSAVQNP